MRHSPLHETERWAPHTRGFYLGEGVTPPNLDAAAQALYEVVHRLVRNDGRMTSEDYAKAVDAVRLAQRDDTP